MRKQNGTTNELPWILVEPSFKQLNFMDKDLARISEGEPR
jgi:hypothetical protein